jgi:hypothetical protein
MARYDGAVQVFGVIRSILITNKGICVIGERGTGRGLGACELLRTTVGSKVSPYCGVASPIRHTSVGSSKSRPRDVIETSLIGCGG